MSVLNSKNNIFQSHSLIKFMNFSKICSLFAASPNSASSGVQLLEHQGHFELRGRHHSHRQQQRRQRPAQKGTQGHLQDCRASLRRK